MNTELAGQVVRKMMEKDLFSQWLGIKVLETGEGYSKIAMKVRPEMMNGLGVVHGGICFSLADSAFAFACNSRNNLSLALDTSINFTRPTMPDDVLTAEAKELHNGKNTGLYFITVINQHGHQVALFKGTCFRTRKEIISL
jgi:acyl-CoA thioesterase